MTLRVSLTGRTGVRPEDLRDEWCVGGGGGSESSLKDFRKDILVELYNEAGQLVLAPPERRPAAHHPTGSRAASTRTVPAP